MPNKYYRVAVFDSEATIATYNQMPKSLVSEIVPMKMGEAGTWVGEATGTKFDLFIIEPYPYTTESVLTAFRKRLPIAKVILASENTDILCQATRADQHTAALTKPFHIVELMELIEVFVGGDEVSHDGRTH